MYSGAVRSRSLLWSAFLALCFLTAAQTYAFEYPVSKTVPVADTLHGVVLPDPYRWLEDTDDPAVQTWTDQENALTRSLLNAQPIRDTLKERLAALWDYSRESSPRYYGGKYFYLHNDGLQNHDVLFVKDGLNDVPEILIDPNTFSEDGTTAMDWWTPSPDGGLIAYGVSASGSENAVLHVLDVATKQDLSDIIDRCRYSSVCWDGDSQGFYYTRLPRPGDVPAGDENYYRKVFYHKLSDDPTTDTLIWQDTSVKEYYPALIRSDDSRILIMALYRGSAEETELHYIDLDNPSPFLPIVTGFQAYHEPLIVDSLLFVLTNDGAPNRRIMVVNITEPSRENWRELIPEGDDLLQEFRIVNGQLVLSYLHNAYSQLRLHGYDGKSNGAVVLPAIGSVRYLEGRWNRPEMFFRFDSFVYPRTIFRYDFDATKLEVIHRAELDVVPDDFQADQVWYKSKDGAEVSMFVVHARNVKLDGDNPTLLTGYGGFAVNQTPYFSGSNFLWLERGGVFAMPNLRGGAEYGEQWHRAGMLESKQNTFDDFIAAAQWLIDNGYTRPERLAIEGGSNGGLLVGAAMVQRPDLFGAVHCAVPLLDMIRYHQFLIARFWIPEYGSSDDPEQFKYILEYSPYQSVRPGLKYPAALFRAGESDGRVHPMHARKMVAALQTATAGDQPILLWMERKAGHGQGKPTAMALEESADIWTFLMWQLGMTE